MSHNKTLGNMGEFIAKEYLEKKGIKIFDQNFFVKGGEIDLIGKDGDTTVFIEVKTRKTKVFGEGLELITSQKIQRILIAIKVFFLKKNKNIFEEDFRIDVISIFFKEKEWHIEHFYNAFSFSDI